MDIAKIKGSFSSLDIEKLKTILQAFASNVLSHAKRMDKRTLALGLCGLLGVYCLFWAYVAFNKTRTIELLEEQLASETIAVQYLESETEKLARISNTGNLELVDGLNVVTEYGELPIMREEDRLTSFRAYQNPFSFGDISKPVISIIVTDFGLSEQQSRMTLDKLPPEITLSLSPYSALPGKWTELAKSKGHEVILSIPIQRSENADLGKYTLFHHSSFAIKQTAMHRSMGKTKGYIGVSVSTDQTALTVQNQYEKLVDEIYTRGLGIFELNPNAPKFIENKAIAKAAPYIQSDLNILRVRGDKNSFEALENIAKSKGFAVATVPNYPTTIKNLSLWLQKVAYADYILAPASAIYDLPLHLSKSSPDTKVMTHTKATKLLEADLQEPQEVKPVPPAHSPTDTHH